MKTRNLNLLSGVILMVFVGLMTVPLVSLAYESTEGTLSTTVTVLYDNTGVVFFMNSPSPCGEAGYFLPKNISNFSENFIALMHARKNGETVIVTTSGCWSVNPCYGKVYVWYLSWTLIAILAYLATLRRVFLGVVFLLLNAFFDDIMGILTFNQDLRICLCQFDCCGAIADYS